MINLIYAELHSPLFLAGTNFGLKLNPAGRGGLILRYDRANGELLVDYNGKLAIVPTSNVASMSPGDLVKTPIQVIPPHQGKIKAQASVPPGMKND